MNNKRNRCLPLIIFILLLCGLAFCEHPSAHKCCKSGVISGDDCDTEGHIEPTSLTCKQGSYAIFPDITPLDNFIIDSKGNLKFTNSSVVVGYENYCVGYTIDQLTNKTVRAANLCFPVQDNTLFILKGILGLISVGFICITIYVYAILPNLRETQDKVTICCISCLAVAFTTLALVQIFSGDIDSHVCYGMGVIIYFFVIAYFAWVNVITANIFKTTLLHNWKIRERTWYISNHIYAWTIPIILTIIVLICQHSDIELHPEIGVQSCWFGESTVWLYVFVPMGIMITINIILFCCIVYYLYKHTHLIKPSKREVLKYRCQLYLKLFLMSGLTWIFEILSYFFKEWDGFWLSTDIINALHGVVIFAVLVIFRKRVHKELGGKTICCCWQVPQTWKKIGDTEVGELSEETHHENLNLNGHQNSQE